MKKVLSGIIAIVLMFYLCACNINNPDITEGPDDSMTPGGTIAPETIESPEILKSPEISETPETTATSEATATPEAADETLVTNSPEAGYTPDVAESPDASESPNVTSTPDVTEIPEIIATPEKSELPHETLNPVETATPAPTHTATLESTFTPTPKPSATPTPKPSATPTPTPTPKPSLFKGSGTQADPYIIETAENLDNLRKMTDKSGLYFRQNADIDLSKVANWTPISNFKSEYDGNGYKITGLNCIQNDSESGLFLQAENAVFKKVNVQGDIRSNSAAGLIAAVSNNCSFANCVVSGNVEGGEMVGGMVGCFYYDKYGTAISGCVSHVKVTGTKNVGGLIGQVGSDYGPDDGYDEVTYESYLFFTTVSECSADNDVSGNENVGGLFGLLGASKISKSHASGSVYAGNMVAGGLIGQMSGGSLGRTGKKTEISECYATGDVNVRTPKESAYYYGHAFVGGLIGFATGKLSIHDNFASGDVSTDTPFSDCQDKCSYDGGPWLRYRNPCGALIGYLAPFGYNGCYGMEVYNNVATGTVHTYDYDLCDDIIDCNNSMIGYIDTTTVYRLLPDETRVTNRNFDNSKNIDITKDMLPEIIDRAENNYCVPHKIFTAKNGSVQESFDLKDSFILFNPIVNKNGGRTGQYKSMPSYKYVNNIAISDIQGQSTFGGLDFANIWIMTAEGPRIR